MKYALRVTDALIKFIEDHQGSIDDDLIQCRISLNNGEKDSAIRFARKVKPHGMGGITDWWPTTIHENETSDQNEIILLALVNE